MLTGKRRILDISMEAGGVAAPMDANHFGAKAGYLEDNNKHLNGSKSLTTKKVAQHGMPFLNCLFAFRNNSSNMNKPTA